MSKTYHRVNKDDSEREQEAPSHKKRRKIKQHLEFLVDIADVGNLEVLDTFDDEEIETFEPIRRRKTG